MTSSSVTAALPKSGCSTSPAPLLYQALSAPDRYPNRLAFRSQPSLTACVAAEAASSPSGTRPLSRSQTDRQARLKPWLGRISRSDCAGFSRGEKLRPRTTFDDRVKLDGWRSASGLIGGQPVAITKLSQWPLIFNRPRDSRKPSRSLVAFSAHGRVCKADLFRRPYRHDKEGGPMKRLVLLTCAAVMLLPSAGCSKWKKKHFYRAAYVDGDACGCGATTAGPIVGAPAAFDSVVPGPSSQIISAPMKGPMPTGQF